MSSKLPRGQVLRPLAEISPVARTARATSPAGRRANAIAFYLAWTVFALGSASRAPDSVASAVVLAALGAAMIWRIASQAGSRRAAAST